MEEVAFGRYRLVELIGEGGMGQVFKAHDTVIGRDVAIKVLPPEMATLPGYQERFRREAQVAARLTEPHIIPIHDTGEIDGRLYLVMPIIEGVDVHTVLAREGPMAPPRAVRVIQQLAAALNAAHRNGLVHRDIKPSNALMTPDEHVYLIDFGIAHDSSATRMTQTGMMVGTVSYMAPERFLAGTVDARADVYALTCVLHECLTGSRPFPGDSMEQQITGHLTTEPPKPSLVRPGIPVAFDGVIARGMAKQPGERFQTAAELSAAARDALTAVPSRPAPPPRPTPPPPRPTPPFEDRRRPGPPSDNRRPPGPPWPTPPQPVGPTVPLPPVSPHEPTQVAPTQQATLVGPAAPNVIGVGRFTCILIGTVVVSLAMGHLLVPTNRFYPWDHFSWLSALTVLLMLGTIPGIVLLVRGRGRTSVAATIAGCALVVLGVSALPWPLFGWINPLIPTALALVGVLLMLVPGFPRPTPALARGYRVFGGGILALILIDVLISTLASAYLTPFGVVASAAIGMIVVSAGRIAHRLAPEESTEPVTPVLGAGAFSCVLSGVVVLSIAVAYLLTPPTYSLSLSLGPHGWLPTSVLVWLIALAAIPGITLLVLGRGRARAGDTIAGTALVTLSLTATFFGLVFPAIPVAITAVVAFAGLLLVFIPVFRQPTRAISRVCVGGGIGILIWMLLEWRYSHIYLALWTAALVGVLLVVGGLIARSLALRGELVASAPKMPGGTA